MSTSIYHITHIHNLSAIIQADGLQCNRLLRQQGIGYRNISYEDIQDRRARFPVPCGRRGMLHDYVPFYFAPRSPMLYTINQGNVSGCPEGQTPILHLVTTVEIIEAEGLDFVFTDGHAVMDYSDFFDDVSILGGVIDWELMDSRYWFNTEDDPNRKCRRQAEFLVYDSVAWHVITGIGVVNYSMKQQVEDILQCMNLATPVKVQPTWYY